MVNNLVTLMKIRHFVSIQSKQKNSIWAEFELFFEIMKHQSGVMTLQSYFYVTLNDFPNAFP